MTHEQAIAAIEATALLSDDWDGSGSKAPNDTARKNAKNLLPACGKHVTILTVAGDDGGIGVLFLSLRGREALLFAEVYNDGDIAVGAGDASSLRILPAAEAAEAITELRGAPIAADHAGAPE